MLRSDLRLFLFIYRLSLNNNEEINFLYTFRKFIFLYNRNHVAGKDLDHESERLIEQSNINKRTYIDNR